MKRHILILLGLTAVVLLSAVGTDAIKGPERGRITGHVYVNGEGIETTVHLQGYGSDEYEHICKEVESGADGSFGFWGLPCGWESTGWFRIWATELQGPDCYVGALIVPELEPPDCAVSVDLHLRKDEPLNQLK